VNYQEDW